MSSPYYGIHDIGGPPWPPKIETLINDMVETITEMGNAGEFGPGNWWPPYQPAWPDEVKRYSQLCSRLFLLSLATIHMQDTRPYRIRQKVERVRKALNDTDMFLLLSAKHGREKSAQILQDLGEAFAEDKHILTSTELAIAVSKELSRYRIKTTSSPSGAFVCTLKAIGNATGFQVNAEHAAREALNAPNS